MRLRARRTHLQPSPSRERLTRGCSALVLSLLLGCQTPPPPEPETTSARPARSFDAERACFLPGDSVQAESSAGAARGSFGLAACLAEGRDAGAAAAAAAGYADGEAEALPATEPDQPARPLRTGDDDVVTVRYSGADTDRFFLPGDTAALELDPPRVRVDFAGIVRALPG